MAARAIGNIMPQSERKEIMGYSGRCPLESVDTVTLCTIGRIPRCCVIRIGGGLIFVAVAINAVETYRIETQLGRTGMTIVTIRRDMRAQERERDLLVDIGNIVYEPHPGIMTPGAVRAYC